MNYLDPQCAVCKLPHYRPRHWRPQLCIQALQEDRNRWRQAAQQHAHAARRAHDMDVVVRDQQAHIRNLEEQLRPHLLQPQPEQEALL